MKKNKHPNIKKETCTPLETKQKQLTKELDTIRKATEQLEENVLNKEQSLAKLQRNFLIKLFNPSWLKQKVRNAGAYILGRRNLKRLYSKTYKRKQASNDLLPYTRSLYEEGFTERALQDLQMMYERTTNRYLKRAIAQELALYFANQETKRAAKVALYYIKNAKRKEHDRNIKRQLAIIEAECYVRLQQVEKAKQTLHEQLQIERQRDVYLALANTEETLEERLFWLNEILQKYNRQPIIFDAKKEGKHQLRYESLHETITGGTEESGPKISVILPAYNAADSIHIAIESMLNQTWRNIELLIVDDCSTDETYDVMKRYAKKDKRIKLFKTKENSGPYVARNIGLRKATGEFITVNDADDWSHPEKLAVQAKHLLKKKNIIANTSELARLTDSFDFYRRGTRGKYIFSNMSSLLFRRKEVLERIGYWDEVRFAADGEFKRRLIRAFGSDAVVDLETGPLSLPEQSTTSLTGSSAFGYTGFFMGARKEYVASFSHYHKQAKDIYYPYKQTERLFPVPETMLPAGKRTERKLDIVIAANFYDMSRDRTERIVKQIEKNKQLQLTTGLIQLYDYDTHKRTRSFNKKVRNIIDGKAVQMIVYGEIIKTDIVFVHTVESLQETQRYLPKINNRITVILIDELPKVTYNREGEKSYNVRQVIRQSGTYFSNELRLFPLNETIRKTLQTKYKRELGNLRLPKENWLIENEDEQERYHLRLRDWLVENHHYEIT